MEDEGEDTAAPIGNNSSSSQNLHRSCTRTRRRRIYGLDRPVLGYRNVAAYVHAREGPDGRFVSPPGGRRLGGVAYSQATLLKQWQPDLMLDMDTTVELLNEDWEERPARRREGIERQGNALWIPFLPSASKQQHQQRHLLVHGGGAIMDRLYFSFLDERRSSNRSGGGHGEEEEEDNEEEGEERRGESSSKFHPPKCTVRGGGMWVSGEVGGIRQIAPLNHYEPAVTATAAIAPTAPPTCFVRGTTEAALFQLQPLEEQQQQQQSYPFLLAPLQKCQFQHPLLDIATRPSSLHRCAFLTDHLEIFEWTSAAGATRLNYHFPLPPFLPSPSASSSRLAWGAHPRSLWLSVDDAAAASAAAAASSAAGGASLYHLDLRQKRPASRFNLGGGGGGRGGGGGGGGGGEEGGGGRRMITGKRHLLSTGRFPSGLLGPEKPLVGGGREGGRKGGRVGAVERHPTDENLLFVSMAEALLLLDLRQPCSPLAVLPQADSCHLLAVGLQQQQQQQQQKTWVTAGCRTMPRLHFHFEEEGGGREGGRAASGRGIVEEWCSGVEWLTRGGRGGGRGGLRYETGTFVNWDLTPERGQPVWLAGLGALPSSLPSSSSSSSSSFYMPYLTSLGDVYVQRMLVGGGEGGEEGGVEGWRMWETRDLPCGVSPHLRDEEGEVQQQQQQQQQQQWQQEQEKKKGNKQFSSSSFPSLPSSAFFQPYAKDDLKDYSVAALDPPHTAFGSDLLAAPADATFSSSSTSSSRVATKMNSKALFRRTREGGREGLRRVLREQWGELVKFLCEHPKSLIEIASFLEGKVKGCMRGGGGGMEGGSGGVGGGKEGGRGGRVARRLRDLWELLHEEEEAGREAGREEGGERLMHLHLAVPSSGVVRVEDGIQMVGREEEEEEEEEELELELEEEEEGGSGSSRSSSSSSTCSSSSNSEEEDKAGEDDDEKRSTYPSRRRRRKKAKKTRRIRTCTCTTADAASPPITTTTTTTHAAGFDASRDRGRQSGDGVVATAAAAAAAVAAATPEMRQRRPCGSSSCLVPALCIYWVVDSEALVPKLKEDKEGEEDEEDEEGKGSEGQRGGGGRGRKKRRRKRASALQGLDGENLQWLRARWHEKQTMMMDVI